MSLNLHDRPGETVIEFYETCRDFFDNERILLVRVKFMRTYAFGVYLTGILSNEQKNSYHLTEE